jgi:hypothetical protein
MPVFGGLRRQKTTNFPVFPRAATLEVASRLVNRFERLFSPLPSMTCDELERLVQALSTSCCFVSNFEIGDSLTKSECVAAPCETEACCIAATIMEADCSTVGSCSSNRTALSYLRPHAECLPELAPPLEGRILGWRVASYTTCLARVLSDAAVVGLAIAPLVNAIIYLTNPISFRLAEIVISRVLSIRSLERDGRHM